MPAKRRCASPTRPRKLLSPPGAAAPSRRRARLGIDRVGIGSRSPASIRARLAVRRPPSVPVETVHIERQPRYPDSRAAGHMLAALGTGADVADHAPNVAGQLVVVAGDADGARVTVHPRYGTRTASRFATGGRASPTARRRRPLRRLGGGAHTRSRRTATHARHRPTATARAARCNRRRQATWRPSSRA